MSDLDPNGEGGLLNTRDRALSRVAEGLDLPAEILGVTAICPECAAGKCGICARQALDAANDMIVDCTCPHGGA